MRKFVKHIFVNSNISQDWDVTDLWSLSSWVKVVICPAYLMPWLLMALTCRCKKPGLKQSWHQSSFIRLCRFQHRVCSLFLKSIHHRHEYHWSGVDSTEQIVFTFNEYVTLSFSFIMINALNAVQGLLFGEHRKGKSERFGSCNRRSNRAQIWSKSSTFWPVWH